MKNKPRLKNQKKKSLTITIRLNADETRKIEMQLSVKRLLELSDSLTDLKDASSSSEIPLNISQQWDKVCKPLFNWVDPTGELNEQMNELEAFPYLEENFKNILKKFEEFQKILIFEKPPFFRSAPAPDEAGRSLNTLSVIRSD